MRDIDPSLTTPNPYDSLPFNPYAAELRPDEIEAIKDGAVINFYFMPHTPGPRECLAAVSVVANLEPDRHFAVFEGFGQPATANQPAYRDGRPDSDRITAHRAKVASDAEVALAKIQQGEQAPFDCFGLARRICQGRRIPIVIADFNADDVALWQRTQRESGATDLPFRRAASEAYFSSACPSLDFDAAAQGYREVLANSNGSTTVRDGQPRTDYRWGVMNDQRERVAVNTIGHTTVEQLSFQPQPEGEKLGVNAFMGLEHQSGIEERFRMLGIPIHTHVMGSDGQFREVVHQLTPADHDGLRFATEYFWFETGHGRTLELDYGTFAMGIREIPLDDLRAVYNTHRARIDAITHSGRPNTTEDFRNAGEQLAKELRAVWRRARQVTATMQGRDVV